MAEYSNRYVTESGIAKLNDDIKDRILLIKGFMDENLDIPNLLQTLNKFNEAYPDQQIKMHHIKLNFYEVVGEFPAQYIKKLKIEKAKELTLQGVHAKEIAKIVGLYGHGTSLMTMFKRYTGVTLWEFAKGRVTRDFVMSTEEFNGMLRNMKAIDDKLKIKQELNDSEIKYWLNNIGVVIEFYRARMKYWSRRLLDTGVRIKRKNYLK
jgi:AraC-like DNA-binding protein